MPQPGCPQNSWRDPLENFRLPQIQRGWKLLLTNLLTSFSEKRNTSVERTKIKKRKLSFTPFTLTHLDTSMSQLHTRLHGWARNTAPGLVAFSPLATGSQLWQGDAKGSGWCPRAQPWCHLTLLTTGSGFPTKAKEKALSYKTPLCKHLSRVGDVLSKTWCRWSRLTEKQEPKYSPGKIIDQ